MSSDLIAKAVHRKRKSDTSLDGLQVNYSVKVVAVLERESGFCQGASEQNPKVVMPRLPTTRTLTETRSQKKDSLRVDNKV